MTWASIFSQGPQTVSFQRAGQDVNAPDFSFVMGLGSSNVLTYNGTQYTVAVSAGGLVSCTVTGGAPPANNPMSMGMAVSVDAGSSADSRITGSIFGVPWGGYYLYTGDNEPFVIGNDGTCSPSIADIGPTHYYIKIYGARTSTLTAFTSAYPTLFSFTPQTEVISTTFWTDRIGTTETLP